RRFYSALAPRPPSPRRGAALRVVCAVAVLRPPPCATVLPYAALSRSRRCDRVRREGGEPRLGIDIADQPCIGQGEEANRQPVGPNGRAGQQMSGTTVGQIGRAHV